MPLSVAIVCKDNAPTIGRVLESVAPLVVDGGEIVAADSGSTDGTLGLLESRNARIIRTAWRGHIATKQLALEACEKPWVLCLDSDEPLEPDLARSLADLLARDDASIAGARVNRKVFYKGRFLNFAWQPEWRLRLVRRGHARWTGLDPHDRLELTTQGRIVDLPGTLRHDSFATFADHLAKQAVLGRIAAQSLHQQGKRGSRLRLAAAPAGAFLKQIVLKQAWRDGTAGWLAAATTAAGSLMKNAALLELGEPASAPSQDGAPHL